MQVFDEVIANVYALVIGRAVQSGDYGMPSFLHPDAFLRAMADPEGTGEITATSERDIAKIEARLSEAQRDDAERTD